MVLAKSIPDAVWLLYATYYALWLEYPKAALGCYKYLESEIFEQKGGKIPAKLIRLLSRQCFHVQFAVCLQCFDVIIWAAGRASGL